MALLLFIGAATDPLSRVREAGLDLSLLQRATGLLGLAFTTLLLRRKRP